MKRLLLILFATLLAAGCSSKLTEVPAGANSDSPGDVLSLNSAYFFIPAAEVAAAEAEAAAEAAAVDPSSSRRVAITEYQTTTPPSILGVFFTEDGEKIYIAANSAADAGGGLVDIGKIDGGKAAGGGLIDDGGGVVKGKVGTDFSEQLAMIYAALSKGADFAEPFEYMAKNGNTFKFINVCHLYFNPWSKIERNIGLPSDEEFAKLAPLEPLFLKGAAKAAPSILKADMAAGLDPMTRSYLTTSYEQTEKAAIEDVTTTTAARVFTKLIDAKYAVQFNDTRTLKNADEKALGFFLQAKSVFFANPDFWALVKALVTVQNNAGCVELNAIPVPYEELSKQAEIINTITTEKIADISKVEATRKALESAVSPECAEATTRFDRALAGMECATAGTIFKEMTVVCTEKALLDANDRLTAVCRG